MKFICFGILFISELLKTTFEVRKLAGNKNPIFAPDTLDLFYVILTIYSFLFLIPQIDQLFSDEPAPSTYYSILLARHELSVSAELWHSLCTQK